MFIDSKSSARAFYAGLLEALVEVMGTSKGYLFHHGPRVAQLSQRIGQSFDLPREEQAELLFGALLADLGMIGLVEDAWENPVPELSTDARSAMMIHPVRSEEAVRAIPFLERAAPLIRHHHEWWDGSGYPDGQSGEEITLGAQILRLADTVAALGEDRPQRPALDLAGIRRVVERGSGFEFGPEVVEHFLRLLDEGQVRPFHPVLFHRSLLQATSHILPDEISPLSIEEMLEIFSGLIDAKDPYTAGHSARVAFLARAVTRELELGEALEATVWAAGHLHDIGKVSVPLSVLSKDGRLDDREFGMVRSHAETGARVLDGIESLRHLTPGCRYHHERWDGRGYPEGLSGERIPLIAQILAVCDTYDAMTSDRAYRKGLSHEDAMAEIERSIGTQLGPRTAKVFLGLPEDVFRDVWTPRATGGHAPVERLRPPRPEAEARATIP